MKKLEITIRAEQNEYYREESGRERNGDYAWIAECSSDAAGTDLDAETETCTFAQEDDEAQAEEGETSSKHG